MDAHHHEHRRRLAGWFRRAGLAFHDAEDCIQETFLRVERARPEPGPGGTLVAFVGRVARSVHADWCRRQRVRRDAHVALEGGDEHPLPPRPFDAGDLLDLRHALDGLPPHLAEVVELGVHQGLPYREVAARLGIPEGTVKSRMFHAVRQLRERLDER